MNALIRHEICPFAFRTWNGDFVRHRPGKLLGVTANQTAPGKRSHLVGLSQQIERVIGAIADETKRGSELLERRFFSHTIVFWRVTFGSICSYERVATKIPGPVYS